MDERRIQTHLAKGDADAMIVQIAVDSATKHVTTVIEYTTLLVLLRLHADPNLFSLIFRSERRNMVRVCNMRWLQNALGPQICNLLLDATSSHTCFGIGKSVALRKLSSDANFTITAKLFSNDASLDDIVLAGEMALCCLYGSSSSEGLDAVRYRHFSEKVTRRTTKCTLA